MGEMIELTTSDGHKLAAYRAHPDAAPKTGIEASSSSRSVVARETWVLVTLRPQSSSVMAATFRVETPLTYISATASFSARSLSPAASAWANLS